MDKIEWIDDGIVNRMCEKIEKFVFDILEFIIINISIINTKIRLF